MKNLLDEAIAESMDRDNVLWCGWVGFDLLPQPRDVVINCARNRSAVITPNFVKQLIAGHDFTSMPDQVMQDLKLASGKL